MNKIAIIGLSGNSIFYSVDKLPIKGETIKANSIHYELGGKGMNQAIASKKLGLDVKYLSSIGNDLYGKECIELMDKLEIDSKFIIKEKNTACASIITSADSSNEVIVYQGANELLNLNDLNEFENYIKESDMLLLTYEIPYDVLKEAIKIGKKYNKIILLNPAPYIYNDIELLKEADIITPNEVEAKMIFSSLDENVILNKINELKLKNVIITLGSKGSIIFENKKVMKVDALKVNALDTTGAGDIFNAALALKILEGESLYNSCRYASIVSGLSVTKHYVLDSIPTINEINKYYKNEI